MKNSVFVLVLISSVLYGLDGNLIKLIGVTDGIVAAGLRALGACLFLFTVRSGAAPKINLQFWGAVICSSMASVFFVLAVLRIQVGIALVLFHGAILWIVFYKWLLMRPTTRLDTFTGILVFIGLAILCIQRVALEAPLGWVFGILSGASFAGYLFLGEEHFKVNEDNKIFKDAFLLGQVGLVLAVWLRMGMSPGVVEPSLLQVAGYIVLGMVYGGTYLILSRAMAIASESDYDELKPEERVLREKTGSSKGGSQLVSIYIGALEPPLGLVFGLLLLGDKISQQSLFGFLVIVIAITGRSYFIYRKERKVK